MKHSREKPTYVTAGFYPTEIEIIHRTMNDLGVSKSAALRLLVRAGARGPAMSPFTPSEEVQHDRSDSPSR